MLFKEGSVADEVYKQMEQNEYSVAYSKENRFELEKLKQMSELNKAAEIFEEAGFYDKAEEITALMQKLADQKEEMVKTAPKKEEIVEKKSNVYKYGINGFSAKELNELGIEGFDNCGDDDKDWEDD